MKVIVTGANGFLGNHLVRKLINLNYEVIAIDLNEINYNHDNLTSLVSDMADIDNLKINEKIDAIFHTAAKINLDNSITNISEITNSNIIASYKLSQFIIEHKIKKVIYSSTCSVYNENTHSDIWISEDFPIKPINYYGISKLVGEWILQSSLKGYVDELVILRYSSIYGVNQKQGSILPIFIKNAIKNNTIEIYGSGNRTQDYVNINDVVNANTGSMDKVLPYGTILNIGSGDPKTDVELANLIKKIWDSSSKVNIQNINKKQETYLNYSINKAKKMIDYRPDKLENGLKKYKQRSN